MSELLWPGDLRAGAVFSDSAVLDAMIAVEQAWLTALVDHHVAPDAARVSLEGVVGNDDIHAIASESENSGNPVPGLVALLRERLDAGDHADASRWVHRGLTSQDVLDSALVMCARDAVLRIRRELAVQVRDLADLARTHRDTPMIARTLTQYAVPTTFGAKVATWLLGVLDAAADLGRLDFPAQLGGAAGTRAALAQLVAGSGFADRLRTADAIVAELAITLGLSPSLPWHTARAPVTRVGDALVRCTDAWGRIANDVVVLARPETGELSEPAAEGRGGSSTMPQKANPVLSILLRRTALSSPAQAALLHAAAAGAVDERPDGAWHAEWQPLQVLARHAVAASEQASELCAGVEIDSARMRVNLDAALPGALAEQHTMRSLVGTDSGSRGEPTDYLEAAGATVDAVLRRADGFTSEDEQ